MCIRKPIPGHEGVFGPPEGGPFSLLGAVPSDGESSRVAGLSQCTPHFSFGLAKRETGRARSKEKKRFDALRHLRASALYGGRREMVPAGLWGLTDGRGGVRYRLDGGFPRRGYGQKSGCKNAFDQLLFPRVPLRYALPGRSWGLYRRADVGVRPYGRTMAFRVPVGADALIGPLQKPHQPPASGSDCAAVGGSATYGCGVPLAGKREAIQCDDHPDKVGTIRHGAVVLTSQKT